VKVLQHLTSVRISDPTLDLSKTIPDEENETDVPLCNVTIRHERFSELVDQSFHEVQSKPALVRHWLDCTAGIIVITPYRHITKMTLLKEVASCKAVSFPGLFLYFARGKLMSRLHEVLEFFDCLRAPLRITENSAALLIGDFLRQFKTVGCRECFFNCILRFHNGKAQFYITDLTLSCDDHVRLFTETITISTPSRSTNLCSEQSSLKFLRSLCCHQLRNAQAFKDLGAVFRNCKHLNTIEFARCGIGFCELLEQIPNGSTCSLIIGWDPLHRRGIEMPRPAYSLTSVEGEKLAGVLPRFNVTVLTLLLGHCCAAAVNKLVCSITHKSLQVLRLHGLALTPVAAAALGRSLPEMSSLKTLELSTLNGSNLQMKELEALFGGINKTYPALNWLSLMNFNVRGSLAPLTKRVHFFPNLTRLALLLINMDERDLRGLLESLRSIPNLNMLILVSNPLGSRDTVHSIVKQALPRVSLLYWQYQVHPFSEESRHVLW